MGESCRNLVSGNKRARDQLEISGTNWTEDNPADTTVGKKTHIRSPSPPLFPPTHILSHYLELKATLGRRGIFSELKEMFSHGAGDHHRNVNYIKYHL